MARKRHSDIHPSIRYAGPLLKAFLAEHPDAILEDWDQFLVSLIPAIRQGAVLMVNKRGQLVLCPIRRHSE